MIFTASDTNQVSGRHHGNYQEGTNSWLELYIAIRFFGKSWISSQFFSWNQSCQQTKSVKPQRFHDFFTIKNSPIFLGKLKLSTTKKCKTATFSRIFSNFLFCYLGIPRQWIWWQRKKTKQQCSYRQGEFFSHLEHNQHEFIRSSFQQ